MDSLKPIWFRHSIMSIKCYLKINFTSMLLLKYKKPSNFVKIILSTSKKSFLAFLKLKL